MASYRVEVKKSALKDLKRLDRGIVPKIYQKISTLADNPRPSQSQKLKGSEHSYRLRIGNYRIVYQIDDSAKVVLVFAIGHRKDIYSDL